MPEMGWPAGMKRNDDHIDPLGFCSEAGLNDRTCQPQVAERGQHNGFPQCLWFSLIYLKGRSQRYYIWVCKDAFDPAASPSLTRWQCRGCRSARSSANRPTFPPIPPRCLSRAAPIRKRASQSRLRS
jgi:hypothetical protein